MSRSRSRIWTTFASSLRSSAWAPRRPTSPPTTYRLVAGATTLTGRSGTSGRRRPGGPPTSTSGEAGRANWRYALLFRDYLRHSPDTAAAYAQIKVALARLVPDDVDAYYDVKDPVCDLIMDAAESWAARASWSP